MKNRFFTTLFFALAGVCSAFAQDFIVLKTGSEIKSKIVELTPSEVKYKAFDNLEGPTITIEKATVFMLRYQNGKSEVVNALAAKTEAPKDPSVKKPKNELSPTPVNKNSGFTGTVFGGVALPLGSYSTKSLNDKDNAAGAKLGFSAGIQVGYRFNPMLSLLCEAQYALNAYAMTTEDVRYIYTLRGDWTHIHILPSLRIETPLSNSISFYGMASAGISLVAVKGDFADVLKYVDVKTQSTTFAYGATVGLIFSKHVNLGFKYIGSNPAFSDYKPAVSTLQATIGYQF